MSFYDVKLKKIEIYWSTIEADNEKQAIERAQELQTAAFYEEPEWEDTVLVQILNNPDGQWEAEKSYFTGCEDTPVVLTTAMWEYYKEHGWEELITRLNNPNDIWNN